MNHDRLLRTTLAVNALSSALVGLAIAVTATPLSDLLGIPAWLLVVLGVGLVAFGLLVRPIRARHRIRSFEVGLVIAADVTWVAGSVLALAVAPNLTIVGQWAIGLVALLVVDYAVLQWVGLRGIAGTPVAGGGDALTR